jgi:hypothetical protein
MVTLAALCLAQGIDMHECGETELARVWTKVENIRAKQAAKPKNSPLPQHLPIPEPQLSPPPEPQGFVEWFNEYCEKAEIPMFFQDDMMEAFIAGADADKPKAKTLEWRCKPDTLTRTALTDIGIYVTFEHESKWMVVLNGSIICEGRKTVKEAMDCGQAHFQALYDSMGVK